MPALLTAVSPLAAHPGLATLTAAAAATTKKSSSGGSLVLIVVVVLGLGLLLVNGRRKAKAQAAAQPTWEVGSMVVTRAGLIATLVVQTEDYVVLQLEDGTRARFVPQAVARLWEEPGTLAVPDDASELDGDAGAPRAGGINLRKDPAEDSEDGEPPAGRGPLAD